MRIVASTYYFAVRAKRRIAMLLLRPLFNRCGKNVTFDPYGTYSYGSISVGNDVYIGPGACFLSGESYIDIGNKVMFGPNVTIITGDHNISCIGKYMFDVKEKLPEHDLPVIIKDDVWVGTNAVILKGVTINSGSVVAAGALVIKDVPSFAIVGGVPARVLKNRFSESEIYLHLERLSMNQDLGSITKNR